MRISRTPTSEHLGGTIFSLTGGWTTALFVFAGTGAVMATGAWLMTPRDRYLEDKFTAAMPESADP